MLTYIRKKNKEFNAIIRFESRHRPVEIMAYGNRLYNIYKERESLQASMRDVPLKKPANAEG